MESLARCGIAFERRTILRQKTPPNARMVIGTAVDRSVRKNLQHKIDTGGELITVEQARDEARDALVEQWNLGIQASEEDREDGASEKDKALDMSVNLAGLHHVALAPSLAPTHVARKWALDVAGLGIQVVGEIDIQEGRSSIRDTKTSGKSPVKTLADTSLQLSTYALAVRQIDGAIPGRVVLDYLVQTPKRGDTKLIHLTSERSDADLQPVLERIALMDRIIESGNFTPAPIDSWQCAARWCPYHPGAGGEFSNCKYAAHPVTVAQPNEGAR
jgi:hypothetical protein